MNQDYDTMSAQSLGYGLQSTRGLGFTEQLDADIERLGTLLAKKTKLKKLLEENPVIQEAFNLLHS